MSVLEALIPVMTTQLATTLKEVTPALVKPDTLAMDFPEQVCKSSLTFYIISDVVTWLW